MNSVRFLPFVGDHYYSSCYGVRILVLGESHYGDPEDYSPDFTQSVIKDYAFQPGFRFFTMTTKLLRGKTDEPTADDRREAWQHVAFYNYVQEFVGNAGRIRPTATMWRDAAGALKEVVAELRPDVILVLGYEMYECLPELPVTWACVKHPCGGMSYDEAIPEFNRAIAEALSLAG